MYKVIIDSCGELTPEMKASGNFVNVPLTLTVDGVDIIDDDTFDQADFLRKVEASPAGPKSACPSPDAYMQEMDCEAENVYVITLSAQLSGSYNSACLAKDLYLEDNDEKNIAIIDSKSASIGQTLIGGKIAEFEEAGMSFTEVVEAIDKYIESQHTFFVLESLETLRKAGRLSNLKAMIASTLNIKPIMGSTDIGSIQQLGQARGIVKALDQMVNCMLEVTENTTEKTLAISHCNCPQRALQLKEKIEKKASFKDIYILDTHGVSSMYANDGGIIMVV
ncbi:MAG: DegV family protein [Lachnospiraceae bacterium]|nr:DegV family protein [Lachnospiraceae bacterium]